MPRAPRKCPYPGCQQRIRNRPYCPDHTTAWEGSNWKRSPGWRAIRDRVLERDKGICQLCGGPNADTAHHLVPKSRGGTDDLDNLAAVHDRNPPHCHRAETNRQRTR